MFSLPMTTNQGKATLQFAFELPRTSARLFSRQQGIGTLSLTPAFLAAFSPGTRLWSAAGQVWRCASATSRLVSRHGTVRPNNSFKPTPLRGSA